MQEDVQLPPKKYQKLPDHPPLPFRYNQTRKRVLFGITHMLSMFAGVACLATFGLGTTPGNLGLALVALAIALLLAAWKQPKSSCPSCNGPVERDTPSIKKDRARYTFGSCSSCGAQYELYRSKAPSPD